MIYRNDEHYYDPTVGEAIRHMERERLEQRERRRRRKSYGRKLGNEKGELRKNDGEALIRKLKEETEK